MANKVILTKPIPFTLTVDQISDCTHDPATGAWTQPVPLPAGVTTVTVQFTLTNLLADTTSGQVSGRLDGVPLTYAGSVSGFPISIKKGKSVTGTLDLAGGAAEGSHTLELRFVAPQRVGGGPAVPPIEIFRLQAIADYAYVAARRRLLVTDELNPPYDTSDPGWAATVVTGGPGGTSQYLLDGNPPWEWMPIRHPHDPFDDTTVVSGIVAAQQKSGGDLPFTHPFAGLDDPGTGVDYEFWLACDPQFTAGPFYSLLSSGNSEDGDHARGITYAQNALHLSVPADGVLGVEIDSPFVSPDYTVNAGDDIVMLGRWIADGGEPPGDERHMYAAEIHPPLLLASAHAGGPSTTVSKLSARPYLVSQTFNGLSLYDHFTAELVRLLTGGALSRAQVRADPDLEPLPFRGTKLLSYRVQPPVPRSSAGQVLVVSYKFVVRPGVAVELYDTGADSVGVVVGMNQLQYQAADLPPAEEITVSLDDLERLHRGLKKKVLEIALAAGAEVAAASSGWFDWLVNFVEDIPGVSEIISAAGPFGELVEGAIELAKTIAPGAGVNALNAVRVVSRGIKTHQYRMAGPPAIKPAELTTVAVADLNGGGYTTDDTQPYPVYGELQVAWNDQVSRPALLEASPDPLNWRLGISPHHQTVIVTNTGGDTSGQLGQAVVRGDPPDFTIVSDGCAGRTLADGESCPIALAFTPPGVGNFAATLAVPQGNGPDLTVTLTGDGLIG